MGRIPPSSHPDQYRFPPEESRACKERIAELVKRIHEHQRYFNAHPERFHWSLPKPPQQERAPDRGPTSGQPDNKSKCNCDPLVCGLRDDCPVRQPAMRPAPGQPGTLGEQLALAMTPQPSKEQARRADLCEVVEEVVRRVLVEELPEAIAYILERRQPNAA